MSIPKTLSEILIDKDMLSIHNREKRISEIIERTLDDWSSDLFSRNPAPAYNKAGEYKGTDLDMSSFMQALAHRGAVITFPKYESAGVSKRRKGERLVSKENRHGKVIGLESNKEVFSFSIKIIDENILNEATGELGAPRNFMVVDYEGNWHDGWHGFEFDATADENKFLKDRKIWTKNSIEFTNFVHPNLWGSFLGSPYIKLKALINRVEDEAKFLRDLAKDSKYVIAYEPSGFQRQEGYHLPETKSSKRLVPAFEAVVDLPELINEYSFSINSHSDHKKVRELGNRLTYSVLPRLRFAARTVEYAFNLYGKDGTLNPGWIEPEWDRSYKESSRARNLWSRLKLNEDAALRYRTYEKTVTVKEKAD